MQHIHEYLEERRQKKFWKKIRLPILIYMIIVFAISMCAYYKADAQVIYTSSPLLAPEATMLGISYEAEVSAYTASVDETDSRPWEMASGRTVYDGAIACPARIPFGAKVLIGEKTYTCEDRMNGRYRDSNHFDILVGTKAEAFKFGRQSLEIIVIL